MRVLSLAGVHKLKTNDVETMRIMHKKADALLRYFPSGVCPYEPKQKIRLMSISNGKRLPYASVTVRSIRPVTQKDYHGNNALSWINAEGFSHYSSWNTNLEKNYAAGTLKSISGLFRITFNIDSLEIHKKEERKEDFVNQNLHD